MRVGRHSAFEDAYMAKFRLIASRYGIFVEYARDAAGRDIGLHFTQPHASGDRIMTPSLAWFQMKGIEAPTLGIAEIEKAGEVKLSIETKHLLFWHMLATPTYLTVYAEATDSFYVINIKNWVEKSLGSKILTTSQKSFTVTVPVTEKLDDQAFRIILRENMIPTLRDALGADDDAARRFLRDAELVKWLDRVGSDEIERRMRIVKWMSKARTEVYFEERGPDETEWRVVRQHWQYMMGRIGDAFPYLDYEPEDPADADEVYALIDFDTNRLLPSEDELEWEPETLLELARGVISIGEGYSLELVEHKIGITLNKVGKAWAETLRIMERAEILAVAERPASFVSVAPWHARQL